MNESKAMLELADRIERANDVTLDDGRLLPVREQRMIVASLRSSAPQGDGRALEPNEIATRLQKVSSYQYIGEFARNAVWDAIAALTRPQPGGAVAAKMCSCKASERDGRHMAWCPSLSDGAVAGTERGEGVHFPGRDPTAGEII